MPAQAPTRVQPFNGYTETPLYFSRPLGRAWGYKRPVLMLTPGITGDFFQCVIGCLTSQATKFQLYMRRNIDVRRIEEVGSTVGLPTP